MKLWHLLLCTFLVAGACQLSPLTQEHVAILESQAEQAAAEADAAVTEGARLAAMNRERELRKEIDELKAEDRGRQTDNVVTIALAALGLGGVGTVRTFGKSRGRGEIARMQARLDAFEKGFNAQYPPTAPPDVASNTPS